MDLDVPSWRLWVKRCLEGRCHSRTAAFLASGTVFALHKDDPAAREERAKTGELLRVRPLRVGSVLVRLASAHAQVQRVAGHPTGSGGAARRPDLLEPAHSGRVGAKSVSDEDDYLAVPELIMQRAKSGYEAVRPVSRVPGLFPLSTYLTNEYLKQDDRRLPAQQEYLWMSCFGAHMAALFGALDELLLYVLAVDQDFTPYLARARNHAEAIDTAFRFRLAFLRRLNDVKRVHDDQGVLDVLRAAKHFQPASEHLGSEIFGDLMRDYERRVFEATVASSAKASAIARVTAAAARRGRGGGRGRGREGEHE
eukprot:jgi/Tetstr1/427535/TSEL_017661.t1